MYIILSKYINHIEKEHSENKNLLEIKNMIAKKKRTGNQTQNLSEYRHGRLQKDGKS